MDVSPPSGYGHSLYAESLSEFGDPYILTDSEGWLLKRIIHGETLCDAMGCYPLFTCRDWSKLSGDFNNIVNDLVSVVTVTDPFGDYTPELLKQVFPNLAIPFKEHFVTDLHCPDVSYISAHHVRRIRKAIKVFSVDVCEQPELFLTEWIELYDNLRQRHDIHGISAFSVESFRKQLTVPGIVMLRATCNGSVAGMLLWYVQGQVAYYHLGAYSALGYEQGASFALFKHAQEYFADNGCRWLSLGAGAGTDVNSDDGLTRFKRGWSTGTRTTYLCGRIFNDLAYERIVREKSIAASSYFPLYRKGEFV